MHSEFSDIVCSPFNIIKIFYTEKKCPRSRGTMKDDSQRTQGSPAQQG